MVASLFLAGCASSSPTLADSPPVNSEEAACTAVKARVAARDDFPVSRVAFCDFSMDPPVGFYVLALQSTRRCEGICSRNMGWFAIERSSGRVFEWNVAEWELGAKVRTRP